jgi:U4/U6 small nuclear ribonucleoprotein PRP31
VILTPRFAALVAELEAAAAADAADAAARDAAAQRRSDALVAGMRSSGAGTNRSASDSSDSDTDSDSDSDSDTDSDDDGDDNGAAGTVLLPESEAAARASALVASATALVRDVTEETASAHRRLKELARARYPELEQLLAEPDTYAKTLLVLLREAAPASASSAGAGAAAAVAETPAAAAARFERQLRTFLPPALVLTVAVTVSSTASSAAAAQVPAEATAALAAAAEHVEELCAARARVEGLLESRLAAVSPNLTALVGGRVAAALVGLAGSVRALAAIPACNVQVLGARRGTLAGMSAASQDVHTGVISGAALLADVPRDLYRRAVRQVAAKATLCARVDAAGLAQDGARGRAFAGEVARRMAKWMEPPATRGVKALARPKEGPKKKRGGRRFRKQKERTRMTELAKQRNRLAFGEAEVVDEYTGEGMGMIGQQGSGVLRVKAKQTQRLQDQMSKGMKARVAGLNRAAQAQAPVLGTATGFGGGALPVAAAPAEDEPVFAVFKSSGTAPADTTAAAGAVGTVAGGPRNYFAAPMQVKRPAPSASTAAGAGAGAGASASADGGDAEMAAKRARVLASMPLFK